jgi:hypothetical protein
MATFDFYIPINQARFPFIILICREPHGHAPPPPDKLTAELSDQLIAALTKDDCLDITPGKFC